MTPNPNNALVFSGNHSNSSYATHCLIPQNQGGFRFMFPFVCPCEPRTSPSKWITKITYGSCQLSCNSSFTDSQKSHLLHTVFFCFGGEHLDWTFQHFQLLGSDEAIEPIKNQSYPHLGKRKETRHLQTYLKYRWANWFTDQPTFPWYMAP